MECYSGSRYGERPVAFYLHGRRHVIQLVEKSWRTPSALHFQIRTQEGEGFQMVYCHEADEWSIVDLMTEPGKRLEREENCETSPY